MNQLRAPRWTAPILGWWPPPTARMGPGRKEATILLAQQVAFPPWWCFPPHKNRHVDDTRRSLSSVELRCGELLEQL